MHARAVNAWKYSLTDQEYIMQNFVMHRNPGYAVWFRYEFYVGIAKRYRGILSMIPVSVPDTLQ